MLDLAPAASRLAAVVAGVSDDQLEAQTPCENYRVSGLLNHVLGLTVAFRYAAEKDPRASENPPGDGEPAATVELPEGWRTTIKQRLDDLVRAWREPAALEGDTEAGGVTLPASVMVRVALQEIVIHGWDLAAASGQDYDADQDSLRELHGILEESASAEGVPGLFGPMVAVPEDASLLDRIIGLSGRDPAWRR